MSCVSSYLTVAEGVNVTAGLTLTTVGEGETKPSTSDQSPSASPDHKKATTPSGNDSTTTEVKTHEDNRTTAAESKTPRVNHVDTQMVIIGSSDNNTQQASVSKGVTKPGEHEPTQAEATDAPVTAENKPAASPEAPTTVFKNPEPTKSVTEEPETPDSDSKPSIVQNPSTVQDTDPELLQTTDKETAPRIEPSNEYQDEEDEDDEDGYDEYDGSDNKDQIENRQPPQQTAGMDVIHIKGGDTYTTEDEDSHFFFHLVILAFLVAIVYITYHNKRKVSVVVTMIQQES